MEEAEEEEVEETEEEVGGETEEEEGGEEKEEERQAPVDIEPELSIEVESTHPPNPPPPGPNQAPNLPPRVPYAGSLSWCTSMGGRRSWWRVRAMARSERSRMCITFRGDGRTGATP